MPERLKAIIDCDPGHDDAVAILLAAHHLNVLGITTVGGNAPLEHVTRNALQVLELAGRSDIPVARGSERPLVRELRTAASVHGESGLGGVELPQPITALHPKHAVEFLIDTVMANEGVYLFPIGPLTNIATALRLEPRIAGRVAHFSLMGGSATWGNATPAAEFNILVDPEAADIVFRTGVPLTMCGLNLTRQAFIDEAAVARIAALGTRAAAVVAQLLEAYRRATSGRFGGGTVPLHDPCAIAAIVAPELFEFAETHVAVELRGQLTLGMTVVDHRFGSGEEAMERRNSAGAPPANCRVAMRIDRDGFLDLVCAALASYP